MHKTLDVITIGEAMAMFVATETGELSAVEHFIKRVAGAELNVARAIPTDIPIPLNVFHAGIGMLLQLVNIDIVDNDGNVAEIQLGKLQSVQAHGGGQRFGKHGF